MSEQERQDIRDLLASADKIGGIELKTSVWRLIPHATRMEFNYGKPPYKNGYHYIG